MKLSVRQRTFSWLVSLLMGIFLISLAIVIPANSQVTPDAHTKLQQAKLGDELLAVLAKAEADQSIDVIAHLNQVVLPDRAALPADTENRRLAVVSQLKRQARAGQAELVRHLDALQAGNQITSYQPLWIINGIMVSGGPDAIFELAAHPDVISITLDARRQFVDKDELSDEVPPAELTWGLSRILAPHVWQGLGIDGADVTVAIMDTGVDWTHSALSANYRGRQADGTIDHSGNWFDVIDGSTEPNDLNGHGTHVAGTAVGSNNIGVAPGAQWIGVQFLDVGGFGTFGGGHLAFQWILEPEGDPTLSPDIVNGSWSGAGGVDEFDSDIKALKLAGIIPVFAAGNYGPELGTIGSPASYQGVLAIGASDHEEGIAWFSSRGPSSLTTETKPALVAPGTRVISSLPGNRYGMSDGTSMAAPHVAGTLALALSANPHLDEAQLTALLKDTAVPLAENTPNNDSGWGRIDAYSAVANHVVKGSLQGRVTSGQDLLAGAAVTITTSSGYELPFKADENGVYQAWLQPGDYSVSAELFGFRPFSPTDFAIIPDQTVVLDINLERLPYGTLKGTLRQSGLAEPVDGTLSIMGTPVLVEAGSDGRFAIDLPAGHYQLMVASRGYRLERESFTILAGQILDKDIYLKPGPKTLLVDSGRWYYRSQIEYFVSALKDNLYQYDYWPVRDPFKDVPNTDDLTPYDVVIWSSPLDAPGTIGIDSALTDYLDEGGQLLVSGQYVAKIEDGSFDKEPWWEWRLRGRRLGFAIPPFELVGAERTTFNGLRPIINNTDSAGNQIETAVVKPQDGSLTQVSFSYEDGRGAGLQAGLCEPYKIVYLGFGLEGVSGALARSEIVSRSYDFFAEPDTEVGLKLRPENLDDLTASGSEYSFQIDLHNISEILTDTFHLNIVGDSWSSTVSVPTVELGPCQSGSTIFTVTVPVDLPVNTVNEFWISAKSSNFPDYEEQIQVRLKTPDHILIVGDSRWYDLETTYRAAMEGAGFNYDLWETDSERWGKRSPPLELLNQYSIVIWYTGYDWFKPIDQTERENLLAYIKQGGRLFLTSQDYMYHHAEEHLTREYLGVVQYRESVTPTAVFAGDSPVLIGSQAGPLPLEYGTYKNFSDGLIPAGGSLVSLWHDQGMAAGLSTAGDNWRTVFWAIPFEKLPPQEQPETMGRIIGWLSDLGDSTFQVDRRSGPPASHPAATRTFTLTLQNHDYGPDPHVTDTHVTITNTLPLALQINRESIIGGATFEETTGQLTWQGALDRGAQHAIIYQATPSSSLADGAQLENKVEIHYEQHNLSFELTTPIWVNSPDLSPSNLTVSPSNLFPGDAITYQLNLDNYGPAPGTISATLRLPAELKIISDSFSFDNGTIEIGDNTLVWNGSIAAGHSTVITLTATAPFNAQPLWLSATAIIDDGVSDIIVRDVLVQSKPYQSHLPLVRFFGLPSSP